MSNSLGPRTFGDKEEMIFLGREIHEQRDYSEKVAEKIVEGRMAKFYEEVCLLDQPFVKENSVTIDQLVKTKIAKLGEKNQAASAPRR